MTEDPKATGSLESREAVVATVDLTRVTRCLKALALQLLDSAGARPLVASKAGPAHSMYILCGSARYLRMDYFYFSSFGQSKLIPQHRKSYCRNYSVYGGYCS